MSDPTPTSTDQLTLLKWRLVLGSDAEKVAAEMALAKCGAAGAALGLANPPRASGRKSKAKQDENEGSAGSVAWDEDALTLEDLDDSMEFVYGSYGAGARKRNVPRWLDRVKRLFKDDVLALVQKDAIERTGLTELLLDPDNIEHLDKNVNLAALLLSAQGLIPDEAKDMARAMVREIVEDLRRKLETEVRTSLVGALRRNAYSPLKIARNIDWAKTVRRNLKGWDQAHQRLLPEKFYFWANQRKRHEWKIIILVDQSGSMAVSAVYSAIMAAVFASIDSLKTHLVLFNEKDIVDMTPVLSDPVEVLFTAQLGGAEDLNKATAYAETLIETPEKTIMILITDLFDTCGDSDQHVARQRRLVESKVKSMVLLKLSDEGRAHYNHDLAKRLRHVGVHCFGCTPHLLAAVMERIMKNQDYSNVIEDSQNAKRKRR